jgi:formylglycine-generating enzyme
MWIALSAALLALGIPLASPASGMPGSARAGEMVRIPAGSHRPLYTEGAREVGVAAFELDRYPVTRAEYLAFVRDRPRWRRGEVRPIFASPAYLADWPGALDVGGTAGARRPVTNVSWFAARSYCEWRGKRLPTENEWEYVAAASEARRDAGRDPEFIARLLELYGRRAANRPGVGASAPNAFGIHDLHDLGWEWVLDFNTAVVSDDSRSKGSRDRELYCAAGVLGAADPGNYPAFLRYAFRSGLQGSSTANNLGFRCAGSL